MTLGKTLTLTLAAGAVALAGLSAAPARADGQDAVNFLAGVAALAIIANAVDGGHGERGYYRQGPQDYGNRWYHRDRWQHSGYPRWQYGQGGDWRDGRGYDH